MSNTRDQSGETAIGPANAGSLTQAFRFDTSVHGMSGAFQNTPVIADGCLFGATDQGWMFAVNADNAGAVWKTRMPYQTAYQDGAIVGSPMVSAGRVYVSVSAEPTPYEAALDEATGKILWQTPIDSTPGAYVLASPLVYDGVVVQAFGADSSKPTGRGGIAFFSETTGALLAKAYDVTDQQLAAGEAGASIWGTPVIDQRTGFGYVGTGNPLAGGPTEAPMSDAIVKFDARPGSARFGQIVASYRGTIDTYVPGLENQPACQSGVASQIPYPGSTLPCVQQDLDFGASPNLFHDASGRLLVGDLQKSGVYHAVDASTMQGDWKTTISVPCFLCNASSGAFDGQRIDAVGSPGGHAVGLDRTTGSLDWLAPIGDITHYESISTANGVAYTSDGVSLHVIDVTSGKPLAIIPLADSSSAVDVRDPSTAEHEAIAGAVDTSSAGVAIARHCVYANIGSQVVALRVPGV